MLKYKQFVLCSLLLLSGCSDYQAGYKDGYAGADRNKWLLLGKADYMEGFHAAEAERFQQDWLEENPLDTEGLSCKPPAMKVGQLNISLYGYERVSEDIFLLSE